MDGEVRPRVRVGAPSCFPCPRSPRRACNEEKGVRGGPGLGRRRRRRRDGVQGRKGFPMGSALERGASHPRKEGRFLGCRGLLYAQAAGKMQQGGGGGAVCCPPAPNMEPEGSPRGPARCWGGTDPDQVHQRALLQAGGTKLLGWGHPGEGGPLGALGTPGCGQAGIRQQFLQGRRRARRGGLYPHQGHLGEHKGGVGDTHTMQGGPRASRNDTSTPNPHRAPPGAATSAAQSFSLPAI